MAPGKSPQAACDAFQHGPAIRAVLSRYATILDIPMSFRIAASRYSPPAPGDAVHVHVFALPTLPVLFRVWPRVSQVHLPVAHGIPLLEGASCALEPGTQFGRGLPLRDGDGRLVGEYLRTNLYCFFDLLGQQEAWVPVLLSRHLDTGLPYVVPALAAGRGIPASEVEERLRLLRDETEALARACRLGRRKDARDAYLSACRERVAEEIRFLEAEIAILEEGVEEMARRITADTRRLREGHRRLGLPQAGQHQPEVLEQELERLRLLPEVYGVRSEEGRIRLTTAPSRGGEMGRRHPGRGLRARRPGDGRRRTHGSSDAGQDRKTAITVKVVAMGKGVTNFMREEPLTLGTLLHELGVSAQMDVRVNGATMEKDHRLADGDQVLIVPRIRGGRA